MLQVGAWTDDCIISTAFHAFSLQYDVVLIEDGVSTASKQHFNAIEVMRGAAAKVLLAQDVVKYFKAGRPVEPPLPKAKLAGPRLALKPLPSDLRSSNAETQPSTAQNLLVAPQGRTFADGAILLVVGCIGPISFAAGWILRGRSTFTRRDAPLL